LHFVVKVEGERVDPLPLLADATGSGTDVGGKLALGILFIGLAVAVLAVSTALWWTGDARRTTATTAPHAGPGSNASATGQLPLSLTEAWRAPSPATPVPLVQGGIVVTGAAGMVTGRDLGDERHGRDGVREAPDTVGGLTWQRL